MLAYVILTHPMYDKFSQLVIIVNEIILYIITLVCVLFTEKQSATIKYQFQIFVTGPILFTVAGDFAFLIIFLVLKVKANLQALYYKIKAQRLRARLIKEGKLVIRKKQT